MTDEDVDALVWSVLLLALVAWAYVIAPEAR